MTRRDAAPLDDLALILDHPKHTVNIAGVVRVMKNFGVSSLRLVEPDAFEPFRIEGIAHRSGEVVAATTLHDSLSDALSDCVWVLGTTARPRTDGRNYLRPREAARRVVSAIRQIGDQAGPRTDDPAGFGGHAGKQGRGRAARSGPGGTGEVSPGGRPSETAGRGVSGRKTKTGHGVSGGRPKVGIVFGREDRGLTNADLDLCQACVVIPTSPEHTSLNLAQACLVVLYELFLAADAPRPALATGRRAERQPTHDELEEAYAVLEGGLAAIDFFKARHPSAIMRTLRTVIGRAEPNLRELRLLAAIGYEVRHHTERLARDSGRGADSGSRGTRMDGRRVGKEAGTDAEAHPR